MDKVKSVLVLQSRIEILVTVPGLGHGVPVCRFHTRPIIVIQELPALSGDRTWNLAPEATNYHASTLKKKNYSILSNIYIIYFM